MAITQSLNRKSSNPKENTACLCESRRTLVGKDLLAGLGGDTVREREFQALGEELLDVRAADALAVLDLDDAEDLSKSVSGRSFSQKLIGTYVDGAEAGTVTGSHVLVQRVDGISSAELTELLVHVVGAGAGVVTQPDTEVLDLGGTLLGDLQSISSSVS